MDKIVSHKDLVAWQKAVTLACKVYAASRQLPRDERFGLQSQLRRAAASIPCNIAEGSARRSRAEFLQFLYVARGSLAELETQYTIINRLALLGDAGATLEEIAHVGRLLNGLIRSLVTSGRTAHARACTPTVRRSAAP
ncbi:four helix bundle protein [Steroidobacter sp. S1-65]|uniref:Four helix bundle protein n=1 Tax=Steroidobacter gossypii TaxID=2805490 RepID=A0ABS1WYV5_9GAMM|nr:four helix bundle protein [Steroidobacter gossypii]MBM0106153.1 four helix bundle protein [Steroidobacter gossypii]